MKMKIVNLDEILSLYASTNVIIVANCLSFKGKTITHKTPSFYIWVFPCDLIFIVYPIKYTLVAKKHTIQKLVDRPPFHYSLIVHKKTQLFVYSLSFGQAVLINLICFFFKDCPFFARNRRARRKRLRTSKHIFTAPFVDRRLRFIFFCIFRCNSCYDIHSLHAAQ